jgi:hypothetical protein
MTTEGVGNDDGGETRAREHGEAGVLLLAVARRLCPTFEVIPGLVPGTHSLAPRESLAREHGVAGVAWVPGTRPGMTP